MCTDLHAGNVLSGQRQPWLLIDPKPHIGDPHYDILQHLLNCNQSLQTDPITVIAEVADLAELDAERARQWRFARCVQDQLHEGLASSRRRATADWQRRRGRRDPEDWLAAAMRHQ